MDLYQASTAFGDHAAQARRLSPLTVKAYAADIAALARWRREHGLSLGVDEVGASEIEDYMASCGNVSAATVRRRLDSVSSLYRYLVKRGWSHANPVDQVDRPRCPDSHRPHLVEPQMAQLLGVVQATHERAILLLLCLLGLRRSEVVTLDCGDVDLVAASVQIRQSKGGHSRSLPIPSDLGPALAAHLSERQGASSDPLFLSYHRNRLSRSALARLFSRWLKKAGLEGLGLSLHSCRHGCASRWLKSGLTIIEVQHLLGHRSVDVTGRYCHTSLDETAAAIEAKVAPLGQAAPDTPAVTDDVPPQWREVLSQLNGEQSDALLCLARSMADPASERAP